MNQYTNICTMLISGYVLIWHCVPKISPFFHGMAQCYKKMLCCNSYWLKRRVHAASVQFLIVPWEAATPLHPKAGR
jgi:hypothetical protein